MSTSYQQLVSSLLANTEVFDSRPAIALQYTIDGEGNARIADGLVPSGEVTLQHVRPFIHSDGEKRLAWLEHGIAYDPVTGRIVIDGRTHKSARMLVEDVTERWHLYPSGRTGAAAYALLDTLQRAAIQGTAPVLPEFPMPTMWLVESKRAPLQPEVGNPALVRAAAQHFNVETPTVEQQYAVFPLMGMETVWGRAYPQELFIRSTRAEACPITGQPRPLSAPIAGARAGDWTAFDGQWWPAAQSPELTLLDVESIRVISERLNPARDVYARFGFIPPAQVTDEDMEAATIGFAGLSAGTAAVLRELSLTLYDLRGANEQDPELIRIQRLLQQQPALAQSIAETFLAKIADGEEGCYPAPVVSDADLMAAVLAPHKPLSLYGDMLSEFRRLIAVADPRLARALVAADITRAMMVPATPAIHCARSVPQVVALTGTPKYESLTWHSWCHVDLFNLSKFPEHYIPQGISVARGVGHENVDNDARRKPRRRGGRRHRRSAS